MKSRDSKAVPFIDKAPLADAPFRKVLRLWRNDYAAYESGTALRWTANSIEQGCEEFVF